MALCLEYDGSAFSGWQSQAGTPTVQDALERALGRIAGRALRVHCAGRTDAGVHALAQWVHFDDPVGRSPKAWVLGSNAHLPETIRVTHAQAVPGAFDARRSARARTYLYLIANTPVAPALLAGRITWQRRPLDAVRMQRAAQCLLGEQDFSSFRAAGCQSRSPMRNVQRVHIQREDRLIGIEITANAFLHHMVRNIAGSLMEVGSGAQSEGWLAEVLRSRDRRLAGATAPPHGLYLSEVCYPQQFGLAPHAGAQPRVLSRILIG